MGQVFLGGHASEDVKGKDLQLQPQAQAGAINQNHPTLGMMECHFLQETKTSETKLFKVAFLLLPSYYTRLMERMPPGTVRPENRFGSLSFSYLMNDLVKLLGPPSFSGHYGHSHLYQYIYIQTYYIYIYTLKAYSTPKKISPSLVLSYTPRSISPVPRNEMLRSIGREDHGW